MINKVLLEKYRPIYHEITNMDDPYSMATVHLKITCFKWNNTFDGVTPSLYDWDVLKENNKTGLRNSLLCSCLLFTSQILETTNVSAIY